MIATREQFVRAAEALGHPTDTAFAETLWRLASSVALPHEESRTLYRDCGYIPFAGFPLSRSGKIDRMTRGQVTDELEANPLCKLTEADIIFIAPERRTP